MLRYVMVLVVAIALVALVTRATAPRRVLWVLAALMLLYTILKLTGVIDAMAPDRMG